MNNLPILDNSVRQINENELDLINSLISTFKEDVKKSFTSEQMANIKSLVDNISINKENALTVDTIKKLTDSLPTGDYYMTNYPHENSKLIFSRWLTMVGASYYFYEK
mgnify:CR=1 FL=1